MTIPILIGLMILAETGTRAQTRRRHAVLALLSAHFRDVVSGLEDVARPSARGRPRFRASGSATTPRRWRHCGRRSCRRSCWSCARCLAAPSWVATIGVQLCAGDLSLRAGLVRAPSNSPAVLIAAAASSESSKHNSAVRRLTSRTGSDTGQSCPTLAARGSRAFRSGLWACHGIRARRHDTSVSSCTGVEAGVVRPRRSEPESSGRSGRMCLVRASRAAFRVRRGGRDRWRRGTSRGQLGPIQGHGNGAAVAAGRRACASTSAESWCSSPVSEPTRPDLTWCCGGP
jgi:hypothetical protein